MNPRATAYTITATIAGIATLLAFGVGMFLIGCVFAALIWVAVVIEQRDDAYTDYVGEVFTNAALKAECERLNIECDALNQENMQLHLELTEAQLWAGGAPKLRVVPSPRTGSHDDLPAADESWIADAGLFRDSDGRWKS